MESLRVCHNNLHEAELLLIEAASDFEILKERNSSVQDLLKSQKEEVDELEKESREVREQATHLMEECQRLLLGEAELVAFLRALPEGQTIEALEAEIDSEKARLELMHEGDGNVIREYEARQKKIDALTLRLQEIKSASSELDDKIKELKDRWEPELDFLVKNIRDSFSLNMEQISCAGEVAVFKDDDFDQWAIHIRVKFRYVFVSCLAPSTQTAQSDIPTNENRENEPLTPLDSHRQSGGERAVSTIFYLMSLQSLTQSPFRVVDEINQGMDPRNERLVHKRMVGIACGNTNTPTNNNNHAANSPSDDVDDEDENGRNGQGMDRDEAPPGSGGGGGSQYFLITPKLLHNLTYERGMRVLCIASGEYMPAERSRVDFKGCVDLMRGLKASRGGGMHITAPAG